jgi:hypothetical protein
VELRGFLSGFLLVVGSVCVLYAVVGRQVYSYFHTPLTYQMLTLVGDLRTLRSSVDPYISSTFIAATLVCPLAFILFSWVTWRPRTRHQPTAVTWTEICTCGAAKASFSIGTDKSLMRRFIVAGPPVDEL